MANHHFINIFMSMNKTYAKIDNIKRRSLIISQKQAYEGAKTFYKCFLPFTITFVSVAMLIDLPTVSEPLKNVLLVIGSFLFYLLALKFYQKCNHIDTEVCHAIHSISAKTDKQEKQQMSEITDSVQILEMARLEKTDQNKPSLFYCKQCQQTIPYRARHCFKCRSCIERYDHHCFWIGNCVGAHNHIEFYTFLFLQTISNVLSERILSSFYQNLTRFSHNYLKEYSTLKLILFFVYYSIWLLSIGFIVFTFYLFLYHTMLILTNKTTWEHMSREKISYLKYLPAGYNPFTKGIIQNMRDFFMRDYIGKTYEQEIPSYSAVQQLQIGLLQLLLRETGIKCERQI